MGRTRLNRAIAQLKKEIELCENYKKKLLNYIETIKNKCLNKEITYFEYEQLITQKLDGKTIQEWLDSYDTYVKNCEKKIKKEIRKFKTNKVLLIFSSLVIISIILFSAIYLRPIIVGLIVEEPSTTPSEESISEPPSEPKSLEELPTQELPSEIIEEAPQTGPSQDIEEPLPSEIESIEEPTNLTEEPTITDQNISIPKIPENITEPAEEVQEVQENITKPEVPEKEIPENITEIKQAPILIKNIPDIHIQKNNYADIKISDYFSNAEQYYLLQTKNILTTTYDHVIKIQPEQNFVGTRKSKILAANSLGTAESNFFNIIVSEANITLPTNITIPANITIENITEANATISTLQYPAVIGQPVKWKKTIILDKPKVIRIKLPKEAENITVNKIIEPEQIQQSYSETIQEAPTSPSQQQEPLVSKAPVSEIPTQEPTEPKILENITIPSKITEETLENITENITTLQIPENIPVEEENITEKEPIKEKAKATITGRITGKAVSEETESSFFSSIFRAIINFFKKGFSAITGRAVITEEQEEAIEVTIEDTALKYEIEYETPAPQSFEKEISEKKKQITISAPDELNYTNILAFTELPTEAKSEKIRLYHIINETINGTEIISKQEVEISKQDKNNNGLIDYIEWNVPHLSNQTYELIIEISKAEHLDENRSYISDIYEEVKALDNNWSEPINNNEYVRVTFEQNLTNQKDITIYARSTGNESSEIEVYTQDGNILITKFENITQENWYKVYLTNLPENESYDIFDLKVLGESGIEFDYIVDPYIDTGELTQSVNDCGVLNTTGAVYTLINNVSSIGTCFNITAQNITLDCNGFMINYSQTKRGYGVLVNGSNNITIKNCNIRCENNTATYSYSIYLQNSNNSEIKNNTIYTRGTSADAYNHLIYASKSNYLNIFDNNMTINGGRYSRGAYVYSGNYANVTRNFINLAGASNQLAISFDTNSNNGYISDNNITISTWGAMGIYSLNSDSHIITNNYINAVKLASYYGGVYAVYLDQTEHVIMTNNNITSPTHQNIRFNAVTEQEANHSIDTSNYGDGLPILYVYNNDSFSLENLDSTYGQIILAGSDNAVINNITIDQGQDGISVYHSDNISITNINITASSYALFFQSSDYFHIENYTSPQPPCRYCDNLYLYGSSHGSVRNMDAVGESLNGEIAIIDVVSASNNNTFSNIKTYIAGALYLTRYSVYLYRSSYNYIENLTVIQSNSRPIYIYGNCYGNIINNSNIYTNGTSTAYGIWINLEKTNTSIYNTIINASNASDIYVGNNQNAGSFLKLYNVTWNENDAVILDTDFALYNYNYLDVNVTSGGSALQDANVSSWNSSGTQMFSQLTLTSGFIPTQSLLEFYQDNATGINYQLNYTVNTTLSGYSNDTQSVNMSQNRQLDVALTSEAGDTEYPQFSDYWDDNATLVGSGIGLFNVTVTSTNGTVLLEINNTNITATNLTANVYNASYNFTSNGTYTYRWHSWGNGTDENYNVSGDRSYTVNASNQAPQVITVYNDSITDVSGGLNQGPFSTSIIINFTAYDADGIENLNDSSAKINFTKANEELRQNLTCAKTQSSENYANYTCNVTMWWWDGAGAWSITAYIEDNSQASAQNTTATFQVGTTTAFEISPSALTWASLAAGSKNITSNNDPLTLNNTGNVNISVNNIQINATNLRGETTSSLALWAGNFSVAPFTGGTYPNEVECNSSATTMNASAFTNITGALLTRGNYTINNGTGQEQLYFCLRLAGTELTSQPYSTSQEGTWTIQILLAVLTIKRASKLKTKKKKKVKSLIYTLSIPIAIFSKKLGCLEAITKYMKENLEMSYSEIAGILNRNDRTIWTAYKKAVEKQPEPISLEKTMLMLPVVPLSIFKNKKLTILEAIIIYLKQQRLRYTEIAKLLDRDQRNIWLIYSRAVKKIKRKI